MSWGYTARWAHLVRLGLANPYPYPNPNPNPNPNPSANPNPNRNEITLFKSVGIALEDLTAAVAMQAGC